MISFKLNDRFRGLCEYLYLNVFIFFWVFLMFAEKNTLSYAALWCLFFPRGSTLVRQRQCSKLVPGDSTNNEMNGQPQKIKIKCTQFQKCLSFFKKSVRLYRGSDFVSDSGSEFRIQAQNGLTCRNGGFYLGVRTFFANLPHCTDCVWEPA